MHFGCVSYVNAKPLIYQLDSNDDIKLSLAPPSILAESLRNGEFSAALVPIAEYLCHESDYSIIPDIAIASNGAVASVLLFLNTELDKIKRVGLDSESRTSKLLTKIILAQHCSQDIEYVDISFSNDKASLDCDAYLAIGDKALRIQKEQKNFMDLGSQWQELTNLPFVYAVWLAPVASQTEQIHKILLEAKRAGIVHLDDICAIHAGFLSPKALKHYLTVNINFDMTAKHKQSIELFKSYIKELRLGP